MDFFTLWKLARRLETEVSRDIGKNNLCTEWRTVSRTPFVPGPVGDEELMLQRSVTIFCQFGQLVAGNDASRSWPTRSPHYSWH